MMVQMENREHSTKEVLMEIVDMSKNFGVTVALNHVNFKIYRGEIRGLIGENGSGKSTVSSIMAGMQPATSGKMIYKGKEYQPKDTIDAEKQGIGMVVQEAGTVEGISIAENIFMGRENEFKVHGMISKKAMIKEAKKALEGIGITDIDPGMPMGALDMQDRKLMEVAKTIYNKPEIFIVDETTTALSQSGRERIYKLMKELSENGKAVLFISHDLEELMEVCDTLTVLRDGNIIRHFDKEEFNEDEIKKSMVGREIKGNYYRADMDGYDENDVVLKATNITTLTDVMNFSMELHRGEILGIGGLSHCGMHNVGRVLYGLEELITGSVVLTEGNVKIDTPRKAMQAGLGYVSKNRDTESLVLAASIKDNIASGGYDQNTVAGFLIFDAKEKKFVKEQVDALSIKCESPSQYVQYLSGGNKQKVVFGKWVGRGSNILILDCPTRGVDIGVKQAMYQLIYQMKKEGKSIVMISEELSELIGMCDRLIIMKDGKTAGEFMRSEGLRDDQIINCMI